VNKARSRDRARAALAGWRTAVAGAAAALAAAALAGQVTAFAVWSLGGPGSPSLSPRLGWLYACLFLHVPIRVEAEAGQGAGSTGAGTILSGTVAAALLTGTVLTLVLAYAAGRRVGRSTGGGRTVRALHGAKVAPVFALGTLAVSLLVRVRVPVPPNAFLGDVTIRPSAVGSFAWPLALALVASAAGGVGAGGDAPMPGGTTPEHGATAAPRGPTAVAGLVYAGAARMVAFALGSSLAALAIVAALAPDATSAYARAMSRAGPGPAALAIGHHVLAAPNIAMMIFVPAMGGCDGVYGSGVSVDLLCIDRRPAALDLNVVTPESGPAPRVLPAPRALALLALLPVVATFAGGVEVARRLPASTAVARLGVGAAAGVVFALAVGILALLAGVRLAGELFNGAAAGTITYGPRVDAALLLALAWGVPGGALGALIGGALERERSHDP
jgi:hypothetical protein